MKVLPVNIAYEFEMESGKLKTKDGYTVEWYKRLPLATIYKVSKEGEQTQYYSMSPAGVQKAADNWKKRNL